jgi:hypothetical protein
METKILEIDEKIKELIKESLGNKFILKNDKVIEKKVITEGLMQTERYYKFLFGFTVTAVCIISIVSILKFFAVFPASGEGNTMILVFGMIGIVSVSHQYKIKMEKLRAALYLFDLKMEMEQNKSMPS